MGSGIGYSRRDIGDEPRPLVVEYLNGKDAAIRAHSCDTDEIVRRGCGDAGTMSSVSETVLDAAHVAVLPHNLRSQVRVGVVDSGVNDGDHNVRNSGGDPPG